MAFVYRKEESSQKNRAATPGPGQYTSQKQNIGTNSAVGFVDRVPRKLWQSGSTPGPGNYNIEKQKIDGDDILYKSPSGVCITSSLINKNGGSSNFKSKSKRMGLTVNQNPGPGEYNAPENKMKTFMRSSSNPGPSKLTKYLYDQIKNFAANYQTNNNLVNNPHLQFNKSSENKQNFGQQSKREQKNNYKSIFNSKVERQTIIVRPQTSIGVGPGSYNISQSFVAITKKAQSCKMGEEDPSKYQYKTIPQKKDIVGPGTYSVEKSSVMRPKTSQSKGIACFGSKQTRFTKQKMYTQRNQTPGPQSYFGPFQNIKQAQWKKSKKQVAFCSSASSYVGCFSQTPSTMYTSVSPTSYNPKNDFKQLLKKNYLKGNVGNFGSTVKRFKEEVKDTQAPVIKQDKSFSLSKRKKSLVQYRKAKVGNKQSQRQKHQSFDERPLCYDSSSGTVSSKFKRKQQKEAPFLASSERFATNVPNFEQQFLDNLKKQQESINLIRKSIESKSQKAKQLVKGRPASSFLSNFKKTALQNQMKDDFFHRKPQKQAIVGPQYYNPQPPHKKQSYNVLFRH